MICLFNFLKSEKTEITPMINEKRAISTDSTDTE